ncbi:MAG: hypothetical protein H7Z43_15240 [Clostridia bacterium]|nr:hypothetical protein [Deltaproteobacteria bacterium]
MKTMIKIGVMAVGLSVSAVSAAQTEPGAAIPEAAPAPAAASIEGKYRFVGGAGEQKAVEDAIEKVVQEMLFIKRPIARGRLKDRNKIATSWVFTIAGGQIKAVAESIMTWASPEDGSSADVKTSTGDDAKLTQKITGDKLVQVFTTKEGKREDIFTLQADGVTLKLEVILTSTQLPMPLKYSLTYKKG